MKTLFAFLLIILFHSTNIFAQKGIREFRITLPDKKVKNSLYNKIDFIDSRADTSNLGVLFTSGYNIKNLVIASPPFNDQLSSVVKTLIDESAGNGQLLFQMRKFYFFEGAGSATNKSFCVIRAQLYSKSGTAYRKLGLIDTTVSTTAAILKKSSKAITSLIETNITNTPSDTAIYTFEDILNIDEVEKARIPVYNVQHYIDGLYQTKEEFFNQKPGKQATVEMKEQTISSVKIANDNGELKEVKPKDVYAIVYKNEPYIATDFGFFPLTRSGKDFYFTLKIKTTDSRYAAFGYMYGLVGALVVAGMPQVEQNIDMKLDHVNGGFIRIAKK